jgi:hypothetical protein
MDYSNEALDEDLTRLTGAWASLQSSRARDSVYEFLTVVFDLVEWWTVDGKDKSRARRILIRQGIEPPEAIEPFGAVIVAAAHPTILDKRMISKWSRVLRFAAKYKDPSEPLNEFLKRNGGLNACAGRYARRLGRQAKPRKLRNN